MWRRLVKLTVGIHVVYVSAVLWSTLKCVHEYLLDIVIGNQWWSIVSRQDMITCCAEELTVPYRPNNCHCDNKLLSCSLLVIFANFWKVYVNDSFIRYIVEIVVWTGIT